MDINEKAELIKSYFRALNRQDYSMIVSLFHPEAIVHSPLYGKKIASDFFRELFDDSNISHVHLEDIFMSCQQKQTAAAHFHYSWTLKNGENVAFYGVDVFEFDPKHNLITQLTIIYDTYYARIAFGKLNKY